MMLFIAPTIGRHAIDKWTPDNLQLADAGLASTMKIDCLVHDIHGPPDPTLARQSRQAPGQNAQDLHPRQRPIASCYPLSIIHPDRPHGKDPDVLK